MEPLAPGLSGCDVRGPERDWQDRSFGCRLLLDGCLLGKHRGDRFQLLYPGPRAVSLLGLCWKERGWRDLYWCLSRCCSGRRGLLGRCRPISLPPHLGSDPRLDRARQIGCISAFHKGFAGAGTEKTVMFSDEAAAEAFTLLRHTLHGFEPVLLAGMTKRGRARSYPLSNAVGGGAYGREQFSP